MNSKIRAGLNKVNGFLLLALVLVGGTQYRWLSFSVFQYADWRFHFAEVGAAFMELSSWTTSFCLGQASFSLWKLPFDYVYGALGRFGFDSNITEKFVVLWPAIFLPPLASFLLVRKVVRSNSAALAGALVYSLNTYFFSINSVGHEFLTVAAASGILTVFVFMSALEKEHPKYYVATALLGVMTVAYDLRMALIASVVAGFYWPYFIILSRHKMQVLKRTIVWVMASAVILVLLNLYWLLPAVQGNMMSGSDIMQRSLFGDQFSNILRAMTLFHPFWTGGKPEWFVVHHIPSYCFIVPLLSLGGLFLNRRNNAVIFFALVVSAGIFLAKQSGEPFANTYLFLFTHFPGFSAFREATKFYFLIAIGYAVLTGALLAWLEENQHVYKYVSAWKRLVWMMILAVSAWNARPLITGEIETMFVARHVPGDYACLRQFVLADKAYSRVLWVPTDVPWEVNTDRHPTIGLVRLMADEWNERALGKPLSDDRRKLIKENYFHNLISNASVRYIVVPLRDTANDGDFYQYYGGSRRDFVNQLDELAYLKKINIGMSEAAIYENIGFRPHLYLTETVDSISRAAPIRTVDFVDRNRTEFHFSIRGLSAPVFLNFTDAYHPDWRLNFGAFRWRDVLISNSSPDVSVNHMKTDGGLNVFKISPFDIKRIFPKTAYRENKDGSLDVNVTLYYRPQAYLNLGLIISLLSLMGCVAFLLS